MDVEREGYSELRVGQFNLADGTAKPPSAPTFLFASCFLYFIGLGALGDFAVELKFCGVLTFLGNLLIAGGGGFGMLTARF